MQNVRNCPICVNNQYREVFKQKILYPEGDINSNLLDINFVRNRILFDGILKDKNPIDFIFRQCRNCGFIWFTPRPDENDMLIKYRRTIQLGDVKIRWQSIVGSKKTDDDKRAFKIAKRISNYRKIENMSIADIGGSEGHNLKYFLRDNSCYIIDFEKWESHSSAKYLGETVEDMPNEMRFDLVLYCHILEHIVDPIKELFSIKSKLNDKGIIYIEVPFGCWREYKITHNFLTHINFFSIGVLRRMFSMLDFDVRYLKLQPTLIRYGYSNVLIAIVENTHSNVKSFNSYEQTLKEMQCHFIMLRLKKHLLNFKLHPIGYSNKIISHLLDKSGLIKKE